MSARTFASLERLCASKGIVCERRGKKIELTTPDGSVTAEADTVADAFADYDSEPFLSLPIKLARTGWQREQDDKAKQESSRHVAAQVITVTDTATPPDPPVTGERALKALKLYVSSTDSSSMLKLVEVVAQERAIHVAALNKLAQWSDGENVGGQFDCPWAAETARAALGK